MTMLQNIAFITLIATLIAGGAAKAQQLDGKLYPGTFCQPGSSTVDITYLPNGGVVNTHEQLGQALNCPIVRDWTEADQITKAYVVVSGKEVKCSLRVITNSGDITVDLQPSSIVPLSGNLRKLEYKSIPTPPEGPYLFHCSLGRGESVLNYYVQERGP